MSHHHKQEAQQVKPYKILAQTVGLLVCGFFLLFIIGEGIPDIIKGEGAELIPFLPFILLPIAGYFVTWFKEWQGAIIMLAGGIILMAWFFAKAEIKTAFIYVIPFIVSGGLFLLHIKKRNGLKHKK